MSRQIIDTGTAPNTGGETIRQAFTKVNSMTADLYAASALVPLPIHNVLSYGAIGNNSTDDRAAIQSAINAAMASGGTGCVVFPGGKTYRINASLTLPGTAGGLHMIGYGGRNSINDGDPPRIQWGGAANGLMFNANVGAGGSLFGLKFENLLFHGNSTAQTAIRFDGASIDSGTRIEECWFNGMTGNAIEVLNHSTNFRVTGGRFDGLPTGYAVYCKNTLGGGQTIIFDGNITYVGGGSSNGNGFFWLDGEGTQSGSYAHVTISGLHTEINQSLQQTYAAGLKPSDQRGVIRIGVNPAYPGIQADVTCSGLSNSSAGVLSYCYFQITSTTGTADAASRCVQIQGTGGNVLNSFQVSDAATSNEIRMFGGNIPDLRRYPAVGYRHGTWSWGRGQGAYETVGHFIDSDDYRIRGLKIQPETGTAAPQIYSGTGAPSFAATLGSLYLRTDGAASTTLYVNTSGSTTWTAK